MVILTGINTNLRGSAGGWTFDGWKNHEEEDHDFTLTLNGDMTMEAIMFED